jgi:hypothetical protein
MKVLNVVGLLSLGWLFLGACVSAGKPAVKMDTVLELPEDIQQAPSKVREAYQFAVENPDLLKQIPCYCGCGGIGHISNYDCYIDEVEPNGSVKFDYHAFN